MQPSGVKHLKTQQQCKILRSAITPLSDDAGLFVMLNGAKRSEASRSLAQSLDSSLRYRSTTIARDIGSYTLPDDLAELVRILVGILE